MTKISIFLLNEVEGNQITGQTEPEDILAGMRRRFPHAKIVLTLGSDGAIYQDEHQKLFQPIFKVQAVDTTAAGGHLHRVFPGGTG